MENKSFLASRTMWVALLIFIGSVLSATKVVDLSLAETAPWIGMAIGVIQMILRSVTKSNITIE